MASSVLLGSDVADAASGTFTGQPAVPWTDPDGRSLLEFLLLHQMSPARHEEAYGFYEERPDGLATHVYPVVLSKLGGRWHATAPDFTRLSAPGACRDTAIAGIQYLMKYELAVIMCSWIWVPTMFWLPIPGSRTFAPREGEEVVEEVHVGVSVQLKWRGWLKWLGLWEG